MADTNLTRTFKYRIYPTPVQVAALEVQLSEACRLYNAAVAERRGAWRIQRKSITFYEQSRQLKEIRAAGDLGLVNFTTAARVLRRVDRAFRAFFRRVRTGDTPGFPRFRPSARFDSIDCQVGNGASITAARIVVAGVGAVKTKWHRPMAGTAKIVTVKREGRRWFACVACDHVPAEALAASSESVGLDVGLASFATLSDGSVLENPRHDEAAQKRMRRAQRALSRCQRDSRRRRVVAMRLRQQQSKVRRQRADVHHKASRAIVNRYGCIAVEDLSIKGLARTRLARSIRDAAWALFIDKLTYKAESAGRTLVKVNPRGTSQTCLCGARVEKTLSVREHVCTACGLVAPRDLVSAQLIERLGRSQWSSTELTGGRRP